MPGVDDTVAAAYPHYFCGQRWTTGSEYGSMDHICCLEPGHDGDHRHTGYRLRREQASEKLSDAFILDRLQHQAGVIGALGRQVQELERGPAVLPFACDGCHGLGRHWVARPPFPADWVDCRACAGTGRRSGLPTSEEFIDIGMRAAADAMSKRGPVVFNDPMEHTRPCTCGHAESQHLGDQTMCGFCECSRFERRPAS